jgi:hypothetical protein
MTRPEQSLLNVVPGTPAPYRGLMVLAIFVPGTYFAMLGKWRWAAFWFIVVIATYLAEYTPLALNVPKYGFYAVYLPYYAHLFFLLNKFHKLDVEAGLSNQKAYTVILMVFLGFGLYLYGSNFTRIYRSNDSLATACDSTIIGQQGLVHEATGRLLSFDELKARPYFKTACLDPQINVVENVPSTLTTYNLTVWSSQGTRKFTSEFPYPLRR